MPTHRSFGQFANRMNFIAKEFADRTTRTVRSVALAVHQTAVLATPVDTGRSRSAWFASFGAPILRSNENPPVDQSANRGARQSQATRVALEQGLPVLASWRIGSGEIFISNGVPYIGELDRGSSRQAPHGMSKIAVQAGRRVLAQSRLLPPGTS